MYKINKKKKEVVHFVENAAALSFPGRVRYRHTAFVYLFSVIYLTDYAILKAGIFPQIFI